MSDDFEQVGRRVRFLIEKHGVSQRQLGEVMGVDKSRLSKLLGGQDPFTIEYADIIVQYLGESEEELSYLHELNTLNKWRHRLANLGEIEQLSRFGTASQHLVSCLIKVAKELAEAERSVDPAISAKRLQIKHLHALHMVVSSVATALKEDGTLVFNEANIAAHLRFPANYYVAALLNLTDDDFVGGAELSAEIQRLVDDVADAGTGWTFLGRVMRQHAHHVNARYSRVGAHRDELGALRRSNDVHDRRMYLIGLALRSDASASVWSTLFDELEKDEFRAAVLAFDTCHYGDSWMDRDGIRPHPTQIRRTALRYFGGLLVPNRDQQLFAAKRLLTLLDNATPNMVREADLGIMARHIAEATGPNRSREANHLLNLLKRTYDE